MGTRVSDGLRGGLVRRADATGGARVRTRDAARALGVHLVSEKPTIGCSDLITGKWRPRALRVVPSSTLRSRPPTKILEPAVPSPGSETPDSSIMVTIAARVRER